MISEEAIISNLDLVTSFIDGVYLGTCFDFYEPGNGMVIKGTAVYF